jgi:hypothetical protein
MVNLGPGSVLLAVEGFVHLIMREAVSYSVLNVNSCRTDSLHLGLAWKVLGALRKV